MSSCRACSSRTCSDRSYPGQNIGRRRGFTLAEALISITILALASASIFLAVDATMTSSVDTLDQTIAHGIALQLLDEASGMPFVEKGTVPSTTLGPEEGSPGERIVWDDLDDYHGFTASDPLTDRFSRELGTGDDAGNTRPASFQVENTFFDDWRITSSVSYVDSDNQDAAGVTDYRRLRVIVEKYAPARNSDVPWRTLATAERVFTYVPPIN